MLAICKGSFVKMKLTLVIATFALVAFCSATEKLNSKEEIKDEPIFVKTLRNLHRGPPELPVTKRANIVTEWIEQKLDHFNEEDTRTWQMVSRKDYIPNDDITN